MPRTTGPANRAPFTASPRALGALLRAISPLAVASLLACSSTTPAADGGAAPNDATTTETGASADAGAGVSLCGLTGAGRAVGCEADDVGLSAEICRCGSRYFWDGKRCADTAACTCTRNCDRVFATREACEANHASCLADAGRD